MFSALSSSRFLLQEILPQDQPFIFEGLSHPEVIPYYGVHYKTLEETRVQMVYYGQLQWSGKGAWWKIVDRNTTQKIGAIGFNNYNAEHRKCEIGYWLLPQYWHKGIMAEVLPAVIRYLIDEKKVHRIEALIEVENAASIRVVARAGFTRDGLLRDYEFKNNRFISLYLYSLLATDIM